MSTFPTELQQQEPTYIEPKTIELYKHIREGTASIEELQNLLDREPDLEGFLNHSAFERRLGVLLLKGVKGVLIAADIDSLKKFNDSQGHIAGDDLVKLAAQVLYNQTRSRQPTLIQKEKRHNPNQNPDLLGRVGGDELSVFMVGVDKSDALIVGERISTNIIEGVRKAFPNYKPEQSMSLGMTEVRPNDTVRGIRNRADQTLYQAKKGKDNGNVADSIIIA